jgi:hypothetical protein
MWMLAALLMRGILGALECNRNRKERKNPQRCLVEFGDVPLRLGEDIVESWLTGKPGGLSYQSTEGKPFVWVTGGSEVEGKLRMLQGELRERARVYRTSGGVKFGGGESDGEGGGIGEGGEGELEEESMSEEYSPPLDDLEEASDATSEPSSPKPKKRGRPPSK